LGVGARDVPSARPLGSSGGGADAAAHRRRVGLGCRSRPGKILRPGQLLEIFGLGRAVARRAEGFAMPIAYCELHPVAEVGYRFVPDLKTLAEESHFVVVATSGGAATHNLVDRPVLDALGPPAS
jgi:hypothetical protein